MPDSIINFKLCQESDQTDRRTQELHELRFMEITDIINDNH